MFIFICKSEFTLPWVVHLSRLVILKFHLFEFFVNKNLCAITTSLFLFCKNILVEFRFLGSHKNFSPKFFYFFPQWFFDLGIFIRNYSYCYHFVLKHVKCRDKNNYQHWSEKFFLKFTYYRSNKCLLC